MIPKLEIRNIYKSFLKDGKKFIVLNDIDFHVMKGEILCILGPSGCGKSTLLRQIAGFDHPDAGDILLDGENIKGPDSNRILVFQDFNQLFPWKTVFENITFPMKINRIGNSNEERRILAKKYLSMVKLDDFYNDYPYQLSGGMKQKVSIARALALNPKVLLMDEPFASLDPQVRRNLQNTLLEVWKNTGKTIIFVTHDIQEAIFISNRIIILDKEKGNIKEIINNNLNIPRIPSDKKFMEMWEKIYSLLE